MSNRENKSKSGAKSSERGRDKGPPRPPKTADAMKEVPVLRYGAQNNFLKFKTKIVPAARERYGKLALLLTTGKYPEIPEVDQEKFNLHEDPLGIHKAMFLEANKERMRLMSKMEQDKVSLHSFLIGFLSHESLDAVKGEEGYAASFDNADPLKLWKLIETTHRVAADSRVKAHRQQEAREHYYRCRQGAYESLTMYKERFDDLLAAYKEMENPELPAPMVALDFIRGLDDARYGRYKHERRNNVSKGIEDDPATLSEAYSQVSDYRIMVPRGPMTATKTVYHSVNPDSARPKRNDGKKDNNEKRESTKRGDNGAKGKKREDADCWNCGEVGHFARDCPSADKDKSEGDYEQRKANVTFASAYVTEAERSAKWYEVQLDPQANISVMDPRLLSNVVEADQPIEVVGLSGHGMKITEKGHLHGFFDTMASSEGTTNILCMADVEDKYDITYNPGKSFVVHMDDRDLVFERRNKMYIGDMSDWAH